MGVLEPLMELLCLQFQLPQLWSAPEIGLAGVWAQLVQVFEPLLCTLDASSASSASNASVSSSLSAWSAAFARQPSASDEPLEPWEPEAAAYGQLVVRALVRCVRLLLEREESVHEQIGTMGEASAGLGGRALPAPRLALRRRASSGCRRRQWGS